MLQHRHTALPVVEWDGRLVGLVSEADVLGDPLYTPGPRRTVGDVMTHAAITVDVDATVGAARDLIAERGLRLLPVVKEGMLVGVVGAATSSDGESSFRHGESRSRAARPYR